MFDTQKRKVKDKNLLRKLSKLKSLLNKKKYFRNKRQPLLLLLLR